MLTKAVLVVDDDDNIARLVAWVLRGASYKVRTASNGREALEAVAQDMPDLILLDMKMPVVDGREFVSEFRTVFNDKAPIVILTAAEDAKERAREIDAAGWIGKPFDLNTLVSVVGQYTAK